MVYRGLLFKNHDCRLRSDLDTAAEGFLRRVFRRSVGHGGSARKRHLGLRRPFGAHIDHNDGALAVPAGKYRITQVGTVHLRPLPLDELRKRHYLFVAGGVGTAPVYPQVKWLKEHGVKADVIIGAKTRDMLIYTDAMRAVAENLHIATDDGSEGFKGLVTQVIDELIGKQGRHYDECVAIGPMIMMKFVALTTKKYALKTTVSLNALMVDGTGMCGACRVTVGGKTVFTCVDGPEFDGFQVDFDEAMRRQGMYRTQEERARAIEQERENGHKCRVGLDK